MSAEINVVIQRAVDLWISILLEVQRLKRKKRYEKRYARRSPSTINKL
jgi:hypothetical protein